MAQVYDNTPNAKPSGFGSDENGEMCNQYLLAEPGIRMTCDRRNISWQHISNCDDAPHVYVDPKGKARARVRKPM